MWDWLNCNYNKFSGIYAMRYYFMYSKSMAKLYISAWLSSPIHIYAIIILSTSELRIRIVKGKRQAEQQCDESVWVTSRENKVSNEATNQMQQVKESPLVPQTQQLDAHFLSSYEFGLDTRQ